MSERADHINRLRLAEHQFRLACTVNLAASNEIQTLDVPVEWTFGRHRVRYEDFGLRQDQAEIAACLLEFTATLVLTSTIRDVIVSLFENPKVQGARQQPERPAHAQLRRAVAAHHGYDADSDGGRHQPVDGLAQLLPAHRRRDDVGGD